METYLFLIIVAGMEEPLLRSDADTATKAGRQEMRRRYEILTRRYLLGQTWEKIAVEMGYSYRHVTKLHGYALKNFFI